MNKALEVLCTAVFFATIVSLGLAASYWFFNTSETSFAEMRNNTLQSQLAFEGGNFHLVQIPAGAFGIFFPGAVMIVTENHEPTGPDVYLMPDGWYFHNTTIENSPEIEIDLKYLQTWTWSCECSLSWGAYTTKAKAVAARDEHNEKTGHDAWLDENMILKPVDKDDTP